MSSGLHSELPIKFIILVDFEKYWNIVQNKTHTECRITHGSEVLSAAVASRSIGFLASVGPPSFSSGGRHAIGSTPQLVSNFSGQRIYRMLLRHLFTNPYRIFVMKDVDFHVS